jgi:hypothetical protein
MSERELREALRLTLSLGSAAGYDVLVAAITELVALRAQVAEAEEYNPYPVEVWSELTTAEEDEILTALGDTSVRHATDRLFASWARRVLANRRAATASGRGEEGEG